MKTFCIAGPIIPEDHYFIPHRLDWNELQRLIRNKEYFVLHAPRQSGKTTAIKEYIRFLHEEGIYNALYINVEMAQATRENINQAVSSILSTLHKAIKTQLPHETSAAEGVQEILDGKHFIWSNALFDSFQHISEHSSKPFVIFIDEIDSLIGDALLSVLRQIRAGFDNRPKLFPHSLCLIGLRDVRDYRIWSRQDGKHISTSSPFNIKSKSLILSNFTLENIRDLYAQHTAETGQTFLPDAIAHVYYLTAGQPWLINALANQACYEDPQTVNRPIDKEAIERAKDALIKRRDTHIDSLLEKLRDDRVRPIMESIITGQTAPGTYPADDLQYICDLGLVKPDRLEIANPIYREIIPRELTDVATKTLTQTITPFKKTDGSLDVVALLKAFTAFYRENSAIWLEKFDYKEAGPHLLMMAFLQRVINGGGSLQREYALGTGRVDILILWRQQRIVIELKIRHSLQTLPDGLRQTAGYMDTAGADEGHLVIFDRDPLKCWEEKIYLKQETFNGKLIHVWGL